MDHAAIDKLIEELCLLRQRNHRAAIEDAEPGSFEAAVNDWHDLSQIVGFVKDTLKPLETQEREKRVAISSSLFTYFGDSLKEGVNNYPLSNGRKLKYSYGVDRKVAEAELEVAKKSYLDSAQPSDPKFDELLRIKYELEMKSFRKLSPEGRLAVSRMVTSKPKSPTLEVD